MSQNQVWTKNNMEADDVWDDTELIKMYEESIKQAYKQPKNGVTEKKFTSVDGTEHVWKVGGTCMAPFEENGAVEYYAATIDSIGGKDNLKVGVTFIYFKNTAVVHMSELWENQEAVEEALKLEAQQGEEEQRHTNQKKGGHNSNTSRPSTSSAPFNMPPSVPLPAFAPPVPPNVFGTPPPSMEMAQSSMLMSWYMSGYHTGYYQAMNDLARQRKDN